MLTHTTSQAGERTHETMTHEQALAKAAKLLRLAQSDNPHEAALAASRAQEIMDRFKLTHDDVKDGGSTPASSEPVRHFAEDPLDAKTDRWRGQLAVSVTKSNQCLCYHARSGYALIGRASDVMACRYIYQWLTREIERLAAAHCAGNGRTYWNNFRLGAVETVARKLRESKAQTVAAVKQEAQDASAFDNGRALVLVTKSLATIAAQTQEVEDYGKKVLNLRARSCSRTTYDSNAREAGRRAGATINIGGARGSLNGAVKRLT